MKKRSIFLLAGALAFGAFIIFTYLVKIDLFTALDFNITVKIQDNIPRGADRLLGIFSFLARGEVMGIILLVLLAVRKKIHNVSVLFLFTVAHGIEFIGKKIIHHPPPPFLFYRAADLPLFRDYINPGFSYPSGHMLRAVFISMVSSYLVLQSRKFPRAIKLSFVILSAFFVLAVALTKVTLGQHWPTDIVGGGLLGFAMASIALVLIR